MEYSIAPIVVIIDSSESINKEKLDLMKQLCKKFKDDLMIVETRDAVHIDVATILVTSHIKVNNFVDLRQFVIPELISQGKCPMGEAIFQATDLVRKYKDDLRSKGIAYYMPIIIILIGSSPTDMIIGNSKWESILKMINEDENKKKYICYIMTIEPTNIQFKSILYTSHPISVDKNSLNEVIFSQLFDWGGGEKSSWREAAKLSHVHEDVKPLPIGWGEIHLRFPYTVGMSIAGSSHLKRDIPCQDAWNYKTLSPDWEVVAVADGLGTASKSHIGARLAVDTIVNTIKIDKIDNMNVEQVDNKEFVTILKRAIIDTREVLKSSTIEEKCNFHDLACTLIAVLIHKNEIMVAHIGDGAVVVKTDNNLHLASGPEESEYVNEVTPITSDEWEKSLRFSSKISNVECMAVFTDGVQRSCLNKTKDGLEPYNKFFDPLFSYVKKAIVNNNTCEKDIQNFLSSKKMNDTSSDDKTIVISILK